MFVAAKRADNYAIKHAARRPNTTLNAFTVLYLRTNKISNPFVLEYDKALNLKVIKIAYFIAADYLS